MTILCIYTQEPNFPASDQNPSANRYTVGPYIVDAIGPQPSIDEVNGVLTPPVISDPIITQSQLQVAFEAAGIGTPQVTAAMTAVKANAATS